MPAAAAGQDQSKGPNTIQILHMDGRDSTTCSVSSSRKLESDAKLGLGLRHFFVGKRDPN